ncbi:hypothetical protein ACS3SW_02045 [Roseobacteraceae bacterium S113]
MGHLVNRLEAFFEGLDYGPSIGLGLLLGVVFGGLTFLTGLIAFVVVGFVAYFPFHAWLTISLFLVAFSRLERDRLVGPGKNFFMGFFARLFSKFGCFCLAWFYSLMGFGVLSGEIA